MSSRQPKRLLNFVICPHCAPAIRPRTCVWVRYACAHRRERLLSLARALLQPAALMVCVVFDENFAALDPENLARAIECVVERAPSLIVIAHP